MRRCTVLVLIFTLQLLFTGCEERFDVDLRAAEPRVVIEANLTDLSPEQHIRVSRTVAFNEARSDEGIADAEVFVEDDRGQMYAFVHESDGRYRAARDFTPVVGRQYKLYVFVDDQTYTAQTYMPAFVEPDSTGIARENIFGEYYYFATFKFNDPKDVPNYYRYDIAVNGGQAHFANVFQDKFNDGLYVTHQLSDLDADLRIGDQLVVTRYSIDEQVFAYWNSYQSTNPGSAAPANPNSNISNGALGYFSVAPAKHYTMQLVDMDVQMNRGEGGSAF